MTDFQPSPALQARLDQIKQVYDAIKPKHDRWQALQTVERARAQYEELLADDEQQLTLLRDRRDQLEEEQHRLSLGQDPDDGYMVGPVVMPPVSRPRGGGGPGGGGGSRVRRGESQAVRDRFKMLFNRVAPGLGLSTTIQGQINRIAEDLDRPLGEALFLLDWNIFARPIHSREREETHMERLAEWGEALAEYHDRLAAEIETRETRFARSLYIWEAWRSSNQHEPRVQSAADRQRWDEFIAGERAAKRQRIAQLRERVDQMERAVAGARLRPERDDTGRG